MEVVLSDNAHVRAMQQPAITDQTFWSADSICHVSCFFRRISCLVHAVIIMHAVIITKNE